MWTRKELDEDADKRALLKFWDPLLFALYSSGVEDVEAAPRQTLRRRVTQAAQLQRSSSKKRGS